MLTALLAALLSAPAQAGQVTVYNLTCDLGGVPAQMVSKIEVIQSPAYGTSYVTSGEIRSPSAHYVYTGDGEYADMTELRTHERLRIRFEVVQGGVFIVTNPFESGNGYEGSARYWCKLNG